MAASQALQGPKPRRMPTFMMPASSTCCCASSGTPARSLRHTPRSHRLPEKGRIHGEVWGYGWRGIHPRCRAVRYGSVPFLHIGSEGKPRTAPV